MQLVRPKLDALEFIEKLSNDMICVVSMFNMHGIIFQSRLF